MIFGGLGGGSSSVRVPQPENRINVRQRDSSVLYMVDYEFCCPFWRISCPRFPGRIIPVIRNSADSSIPDIARQLDQVIRRARSGKMTLDDVQGGTFTLNNTGTLGSVWGGAIINHPQAAILTTEAIVKRVVVISKNGKDTVAVRSMMNLCLSFDHRIIDGADSSNFLQAIKTDLEAKTLYPSVGSLF
jgi:pyruvate/2-oxoglutarate dehydrogenase complex dihydrolipoamide acyltransferase (E2) component